MAKRLTRSALQRLESLQRAGVTHIRKMKRPIITPSSEEVTPTRQVPPPASTATSKPTRTPDVSVAAAQPTDARCAALAEVARDVAACTREATHWSQPLLHHEGEGLVGFLCQNQGGVLHFLVRGSLEPGNRDGVQIGPTVACSEVAARATRHCAPPFLEAFLEPAPGTVRYDAVQSEEEIGRAHV